MTDNTMIDNQATIPTVDIHELTCRFGDFVAVDRASFTVDRGEIFDPIGPNGAGKSTLIKMLTTLLPLRRVAPQSSATTSCGNPRPSVAKLATCRNFSPLTAR
jgi:ABC-type branched-subunit amino acid transport system ATPase component